MQDSDVLIAHMLLNKYLDKLITSNAYKFQVYMEPGALSRRLDESQKFCIQLLLPERVVRNNHRARGGRASGKRRNADIDDVEDYSDEDGEEDRVERLGNTPESSSAAKRRRRSSYNQHHASSSRVPAAAALEIDVDSGMEEDADDDSEYESEDLEWKGNLRGAPAAAHRTLRNKSHGGAQRKAGVASRLSGASEINKLPIYDDEVIDISSE